MVIATDTGLAPVEETALAPIDDTERSLIANLDRGEQALAAAETDYERMRIRNTARAAQFLAGAINRRRLVRRFSVLVQRAERDIMKANPPLSNEESRAIANGVRYGDEAAQEAVQARREALEEAGLSSSVLGEIRQAHAHISDEEFLAIAATDTDEPLSRAQLIEIANAKRHEEEEAVDRARQEQAQPHLSRGEGNEGWYTPAAFLSVARATMGAIDLDPASHSIAQARVMAAAFYTKDDDGLVRPWRGRVFLNPPYTGGLVDRFADKLVEEYEAGNVTEAVWLTNNSADTGWFHRLVKHAAVVVFIEGRVKFWGVDEDGKETLGTPLQGQVFLYLGPNAHTFAVECAARPETNGYISKHALERP